MSARLRGLAVCLALSVAACSGGAGRNADGPDPVRVVLLPYLSMAPFHIAAEEGYFAERGLEVEFVRLGRIQEVLSALSRGDVDVAAGFLTVSTLNAIARGERIRVVAALAHQDPDSCAFNAFVARPELVESGALQDPERVRGLRADVDVLTPLGYWFDTWLAPMGLSLDDLEVVNLPSPAAVDALTSDVIDVTNEAEPYLSVLAASPRAQVYLETKEILPYYAFSAMMYSHSLLDERPEVGERFAAAMLKALRQFRRGKTEHNLDLVEDFTGLTREQVRAACWPVGPEDGRMDASTLVGFQEWALSRGFAERVLSEDEFVDHRFVESANAALSR